jgi:hypothetical protein
LIVIARLVRATHEHRGCRKTRGDAAIFLNAEIMGGPDKPGNDDI